MQLEKMESKHYKFIEKEFDLNEDSFIAIAKDSNSQEFDTLVDGLTWIECDEIEASEGKEYSERGALASELIDILCGPYDPDEINEDEVAEE